MGRKIKTIVFIILLIFYNAREKMFTNSLLHICCVGRFLRSVLLNGFMNKQMFPFFYNNYRTLSHLELNFKRRLIVMDLMFENWEYHFHDIFKYPPL